MNCRNLRRKVVDDSSPEGPQGPRHPIPSPPEESMSERDPALLAALAAALVGTAGRTNLDRARAALDAIEEAGWQIRPKEEK